MKGEQTNLGRETQIAVMTKDGGFHVLPVGALKDRNEKPSHAQVLEMLDIDLEDAEAGGSVQCKDNGRKMKYPSSPALLMRVMGTLTKARGAR